MVVDSSRGGVEGGWSTESLSEMKEKRFLPRISVPGVNITPKTSNRSMSFYGLVAWLSVCSPTCLDAVAIKRGK